MYYTKEQELEQAVINFAERVCNATLSMVETTKMAEADKRLFATGVMCVIDTMRTDLVPVLKAIVKENPRYFENNN
jgi:coproporphyrinogen III oxidase